MIKRKNALPTESDGIFPEEVSFEKLLERDVKVVRLAGLHSLNSVFSDKIIKPAIWEPIAFGIGAFHIFFVISCEFATAITVWRDDPEFAVASTAGMLSGFLCTVKGIRVWLSGEEIRKLLRIYAVMWDETKDQTRIRKEILSIAAKTSHLDKWYIIMVTTLALSWDFRPYILLLHYHMYEKSANTSYDYTITLFPTSYPLVKVDTIIKYIICVSWEQVVILFIALYWLSCDTMFAQISTHTAIQFQVLRHNLKYITGTDDDHNTYDEKTLIHRLSAIARRHHDLCRLIFLQPAYQATLIGIIMNHDPKNYTEARYCEMIECIYDPITFLTILLGGVHLCFCVFRVEKESSHGNWEEVFKFLFHGISLMAQAVLYCAYADRLTQQSSLVAQAAYECEWTERSKEFKIILQTIMMRSQKFFKCTAYGFFSVNLNQITAIANTAASYFALLKTMT